MDVSCIVDEKLVVAIGRTVVAYDDVACIVGSSAIAYAARDGVDAPFVVEHKKELLVAVVHIEMTLMCCALLGIGAVDIGGGIALIDASHPKGFEREVDRFGIGFDFDCRQIGWVEIVGSDEVTSHKGIGSVVGVVVDGPDVDFEASGVEFLNSLFVETTRLNIYVHLPLDAPVEMVSPIGIGEKLECDVGVVGAEIFEARLHRGEDNALVAEALFVDEFDQSRHARLVVAIDACGPFEFDDGEDVVLGTDVEILGKGADGAGIGDATTSLGIGFGFELSKGRTADGERTSEATSVVVVREDNGAIASHFDVALEIVVALECTINECFGCVFYAPITATMANEEGLG